MSRRVGLAVVVIVATAALSVTACGADVTDGRPATASSATGGGKTACELITPDVIRAAHFPDRVFNQSKNAGRAKDGGSGCAYGDDPDPAHISASFLALVTLPPAALAGRHTTGTAYAKANGYPCRSTELRTFGPDREFHARAYFCASSTGTPSGGWVWGGDAYLLEVGYPDVDYGPAAEGAAEFEAVARAIAKNIDR